MAPTEEHLEEGSEEFRRLAKLQGLMRMVGKGMLQVSLVFNDRNRWCTVCPPLWRTGDTCLLAHVEIQKTLKRLQLSWYWPGVAAEVRRIMGQCEVCQRGSSLLKKTLCWKTVAEVDRSGGASA